MRSFGMTDPARKKKVSLVSTNVERRTDPLEATREKPVFLRYAPLRYSKAHIGW